jgi:hypothetical protein
LEINFEWAIGPKKSAFKKIRHWDQIGSFAHFSLCWSPQEYISPNPRAIHDRGNAIKETGYFKSNPQITIETKLK